MSVVILGGIDRLKPYYLKQGRNLGFTEIKVFSKKFFKKTKNFIPCK